MKVNSVHYLLLVLFGLIESFQLTFALVLVLKDQPRSGMGLDKVLPEWQTLLLPEWDVLLYRVFVTLVLVIGVGAWWWYQRQENKEEAIAVLCPWVMTQGVISFLLGVAWFKMAVYQPRQELAFYIAILLLGVAFLHKLWWSACYRFWQGVVRFILGPEHQGVLKALACLMAPLLIFLIIDLPHPQGVIARFYFGEQFHHNDSFIYGPAFAYLSGAIPNVDVISQYGVGVGVILGGCMKLLGGFSYANGLSVMLVAAILYYTALFYLLRRWLKSTSLALAGILWVMKIHLFHPGVYPLAFTYGSATVLRFWLDIVVYWSLWAHSQRARYRYLGFAALACGVQLFYLPSEGIYLTAAFVGYMFLQLLSKQNRLAVGFHVERLAFWVAIFILPFAVMFALLWVFIGPMALSAVFWKNMGEFIEYFLSGFGVTPIYSSLQDKQYLASLMGFVVPSVYVLSLLIIGSLLWLNKISRQHFFVIFLCLYGLGAYHYYVARSATTSYYVVAIPYALIICFWVSRLINVIRQDRQLWCKGLLLVLSVFALVTNHQFLSYPNRLNFSHNPLTDPLVAQPLDKGKPYLHHLFREYAPALKVERNSLGETQEPFVGEYDFKSDDQLVDYYWQESDFKEDAALISRLTAPDSRVALISSFEIKILSEARRKPYFYYFPLVISHPMRARNLVRISVYTKDQLQKVFTGLEKDNLEYIFMEKVFLSQPLPRYFYDEYSAFLYLRDYILQRYEPFEAGRYLVALKRKVKG